MASGRTLTVLVADVVSSTELFGRLGVDRADEARRALFKAFSIAVRKGDGVLIKTMGDGCLASFAGAAEAVTTAIALQQAVARLREREVPALGLRVGMAVGDVTEEDGDVFGPAVVTASRLCSAAGERRAVLVAGEPGVGKTRLVAAAARVAHASGALVLFGRCDEELAVAFQPVAEALRSGLAGLDPDVVAAHVAEHGGEIRRLAPAIDAAEPVEAEPATEQVRLFAAVTDLLQRASEHRPVVLVLDDLHWAAASTIALVRHLLGAGSDHRLCVLATYRGNEIDRGHALGALLAEIRRSSGIERLALRGLDGHAIEELLAAGGELDDDARILAAAVVERTAGNAFFANQVLRHLVERGVLVQDSGRWRTRGSLDDVDLPEDVLDVVGRRLSGLSPAANQALAVGAVGGLEIAVRVLSRVSDAGTPDAVVDSLDEAVRAGVLVETGPGRLAFTHAIVRDALTGELTAVKRARLHRALGEAILAVYADATDLPLSELAHHFIEAALLGDSAAAAQWSTAAASAAAGQADHRGAIAVLEHALAIIESVEPVDQAARFEVAAAAAERRYALTETDSASVGSAVDAARRLRSGERMLRIAVGRYHRGAGVADPEGIDLYEEALRFLDPAAVPLRALAVAALAWRRSLQAIPDFTDDVEAARTLLLGIDAIAPKVAAATRGWIVNASLGLPGAALRLRLSDEALAVAPEAEDPWWAELATGIDITGLLHVWRGHSLMVLGRRGEFEINLAHITERAQTTGDTFLLGTGHGRTALLALLDGRFGDVSASADRMLEAKPTDDAALLAYFGLSGAVANEQGRAAELLPLMQAGRTVSPDLHSIHAAWGRCCLENGDHTGAAEALSQLAGRWSGWARDSTWPFTLAQTAEVVAGLVATEHAELIADELAPYAGELVVVGHICIGAFDRYRGMLLSLLDRHDEALAALSAALRLEESVESPPLIARTRYWLARALQKRNSPGDWTRATIELDRSIETAERLGMSALALAARELANAHD